MSFRVLMLLFASEGFKLGKWQGTVHCDVINALMVAPPPSPRAWWPATRDFISGYAAGMALIAAGHPFDTIKVRLQTAAPGQFTGPLHCVSTTVRREGLRGLYKGVAAPLLLTGVINSVLFGLNNVIVNQGMRMGSWAGSSPSDIGRPFTITEATVSAVISGALISVVVTPIEGVKTRLQVQYNSTAGTALYKGPLDCARKVVAAAGWSGGLYRGWSPTCFCRMSNYAYFGSYAVFKSAFTPEGHTGPLPLLSNVAAGGCAGITYWLSCYPVDVIKNRMQAAGDSRVPVYRGFWHCASSTVAAGGVRALFKGFTPCLVRAFPANAACFVTYELVSSALPPSLPW